MVDIPNEIYCHIEFDTGYYLSRLTCLWSVFL